uniref:NADH-ubiquinone oxidoreductase chain 5 n=1 Tax=Elysia ornata TaxID=305967 RepID=A0A342KD12_9GAST|nr:NADH dehydrogenase subunit 5 [Elysia ornata]ANI87282.1 NADH dehydrogenase subunit 5 [Elysia ornata]
MANFKSLKFSVILLSLFITTFCLSMGAFLLEESFILSIELFELSSSSFGFDLVFDKTSLSFASVVMIISSSVFSFSYSYMSEDPFQTRFLWILLAFVGSMNLLIFSGSVFFLFIGWDGLGITSFALIIYYQSSESLSAGFQTLMINRIGDALIVLATFMFVILGQFSFISLPFNFWIVPLVIILMFAGLTKSAQYPFSSWLPAAMAAPTPVSALVHSSTLVTAGIFLIIRLSYWIPLPPQGSSTLLFCGAVTCLLGGWSATYENDLKKIIALSTLSQLGVMVFCLGLGLPSLALFHLYTHALFKALLFIAAGHVLMTAFGAQDIRLLGGVGMLMPFTSVIFGVSSFCLVGAPFLSAFYSKHMILEKMFMSPGSTFSTILMLVATFFTAKYVSRSMKCILWSKSNYSLLSKSSPASVILPMTILSLGAIASGKFIFLVDISNLEEAYISSILGGLINFVTIFGVVLGLFDSANPKNSFFLSTMFFLTPMISYSSKILSPLVNKMTNLDYGWLEPSFIMKSSIQMVGSSFTSFFMWPNMQLSMVRSGLIFSTLLLIAFTFNF